MGGTRPRIAVVGSINLDLVAACERLPAPGETVRASSLDRFPGGKGANQAVAAARLGAQVRMIGCVGDDAAGTEMREALVREGVEVATVATVTGPTGLALICVDATDENQIVVVTGANGRVELPPGALDDDGVLCQLEIPIAVVAEAGRRATGLFCVNAAPAQPLPHDVVERCDLVIVNETEHAAIDGLDRARLVAVTLGARGAVLLERGAEVARAEPPAVDAIDTVGAGDAFCAALVTSLLDGMSREAALRRAVTAGAIAVSRRGAQPSLPTAEEIDGWPAATQR